MYTRGRQVTAHCTGTVDSLCQVLKSKPESVSYEVQHVGSKPINCLCIEYTTLAASSAPSWIQCLFDDLSLGVGGRRWAPFQDTRPPDISICQPRSSQEAVRRQSGGSPRPGHTPPPPSSPSGDFYNIT